MIAHLRGRILEKQPTRVVVDVGGVGYDVAVPLSTFYGLGEPGAEVVLSNNFDYHAFEAKGFTPAK